MMPMATAAKNLFGILNLNHWDLLDIWILVLGIFIFAIVNIIFDIQ
jgi:hypothetical protein